MNQTKLISLASNFVSFLIPRIKFDKAILYGSVANNTFDKESDIDLFISTDKKNQKKIKQLLELYKKTSEYEKFRLVGIENEISVKCGKLDEWKSLKSSIISNGIMLYGRYNETPEKLNHKVLFITQLINKSKAEKIKIWRRMYGYKQKIGKKTYVSEGIAERKIGKGAFIVSPENLFGIKEYLNKNKIKYQLIDIWL